MKKKAIIAIVSLVVFGQGAWAQDVEWPETIGSMTLNDDNSSNKFYPVSSVDNLNDLAVYVNEGNTCEGLTFKVTDNITFSQSESDEFVPIGYGDGLDGVPFAGTFDGLGNVISGINYSDPEGTSIGLFGYISGALIQNVKMDHCSFTGNFDVGAIAGLASGVHDDSNHGIFNCIVGSHVTVEAVSITIESDEEPGTNVDVPGTFAGGIIGECADATLSGCVSAATVTGDDCVGGIAGRLISSLDKDDEERGVIENCLFMGSVTGTTNIGDIVGACGAVIEGEEGTEGLLQPAELTELTLLDNDTEAVIDNATWLSCYNGAEGVDVTLAGRTLIKDGYWNTLCLPFDVDDFEGTPLEDATVMTLGNSDACDTRYDAATGTLHLEFLPANKIKAGLPYIVKWKSGDDISDPVFNGVTIRNENPSDQSVSSKDGAVTFVGSYSPFVIDETNIGNILYIGSANKIGHSANARTLRSCRAHFELTNPSAAPVRTVVVDYGEEEIVTGIISMEDGRSQMEDDSWWTLSGVKLNGKPTEKGIYLFNGKKVVVQ